MLKTLSSGLVVDSQEYYDLLDWKDKHMKEFSKFCSIHFGTDISNCTYSINNMTLNTYNNLLRYSKLKP